MNEIRHMYGDIYKIEGWLYDSTVLLSLHYQKEIGTLSLHFGLYTKVTGTLEEVKELQKLIKDHYNNNPYIRRF